MYMARKTELTRYATISTAADEYWSAVEAAVFAQGLVFHVAQRLGQRSADAPAAEGRGEVVADRRLLLDQARHLIDQRRDGERQEAAGHEGHRQECDGDPPSALQAARFEPLDGRAEGPDEEQRDDDDEDDRQQVEQQPCGPDHGDGADHRAERDVARDRDDPRLRSIHFDRRRTLQQPSRSCSLP